MNKLTYLEVSASLNDFANLSYQDRGSFSYACGTFQSMLSSMVADLPKHKQAEFLRTLEGAMQRVAQPA
jgi:hypothetical protein